MTPSEPTTSPARIHVVMVGWSSHAVVIRRGPSKQVCTILWDRADDTFQVGQWLKGKIYAQRCDLSPGGKYLIYFALKGRRDTDAMGSWTAISRAPYLKAVGLWPTGHTWGGGGVFLDERRFWLDDGVGRNRDYQPLDSLPADLEQVYEPPAWSDYTGECRSVYCLRLSREGWRLIERRAAEVRGSWDRFQKPVEGGDWKLEKRVHYGDPSPAGHPGRGVIYETHELFNVMTDSRRAFESWEWAEVDGRQIFWSEGGKLFASALASDGGLQPRELCDFNPLRFSRIQAPY